MAKLRVPQGFVCSISSPQPLCSQPPCNPQCQHREAKLHLMQVRAVKRGLGNLILPSKRLDSPPSTGQEGMYEKLASHSQRCHRVSHPVTPPEPDRAHTEGLAAAPWAWNLPGDNVPLFASLSLQRGCNLHFGNDLKFR